MCGCDGEEGGTGRRIRRPARWRCRHKTNTTTTTPQSSVSNPNLGTNPDPARGSSRYNPYRTILFVVQFLYSVFLCSRSTTHVSRLVSFRVTRWGSARVALPGARQRKRSQGNRLQKFAGPSNQIPSHMQREHAHGHRHTERAGLSRGTDYAATDAVSMPRRREAPRTAWSGYVDRRCPTHVCRCYCRRYMYWLCCHGRREATLVRGWSRSGGVATFAGQGRRGTGIARRGTAPARRLIPHYNPRGRALMTWNVCAYGRVRECV